MIETSECRFSVAPIVGSQLLECRDIAEEAFGFDEADLVPAWHMLTVARHGGLILGATYAGALVGYSYAFPGFDAGESYLYSSGLQVRLAFWSRGVGRALKLAQREHARALGYTRMLWPVDALASRPLHLYLNRLGARVIGFQRSPFREVLQDALADELEIVWSIGAPGEPEPKRAEAAPTNAVEIPWDVRELEARAPRDAMRWRAEAGKVMAELLDVGLTGWRVALDRSNRRSYVVFAAAPPVGDLDSSNVVYRHQPRAVPTRLR